MIRSLLLFFFTFYAAILTAAPQQAPKDLSKQEQTQNEDQKPLSFGIKTSALIYYFYIKPDRGGDDDQQLDYGDSRYKMKYRIEPVYMASLQAYLRWDFLTFSGDYATDRVFKGGGTIEQDEELVSKLTKNQTFSEILRFGIEVFDLNTSYRMVQFDFGRADVYDNATNERVSSGQMKLNVTDIDISYDFYPLGRTSPFKISPGYKYMNYSVPRIVYRFADTTEGKQDNWVYTGESEAQTVRTETHMGGAVFDMGTDSINGKYSLLCSMGMYGGPSQTHFNYGGSRKHCTLVTLAGILKTGISYHLIDSAIQGNISFLYDLSFINTMSAETNTEVNGSYSESKSKYAFGSTDLYNGFYLSMDLHY